MNNYELRKEEWLKDNGYTEGDVMESGQGEFVISKDYEYGNNTKYRVYLQGEITND